MKYAIQVVITTDEGQTETQDIACPEREDLTLTILGLTLAEGKAILKALQEVVVQQQMTAYLETQRPYGHCGRVQRSTGYHTTQVRTVFGTIPVHSLRLYQVHAQHAGKGERFGQKRVGLFLVARVVALEQGVGIVAAGPGQLRTVASRAAEDERTLEVGHRLVEMAHDLRHEPQQPVSGGYATVHHGALP